MFELKDQEVEESFKLACEYVKIGSPKGNISLEDQLKMYSFFKQATVGPCSQFGGERPGFFHFEAKSKWDAWNLLGDMSKLNAMTEYIKILSEIFPDWNSEQKSRLRKDFDEFLRNEKRKGGIITENEDWIKGKFLDFFKFRDCIKR